MMKMIAMKSIIITTAPAQAPAPAPAPAAISVRTTARVLQWVSKCKCNIVFESDSGIFFHS